MNLKQAIQILTNGQWHSIRFFTADLLKEKGGQYLEFNQCRIARKQLLEASGMPTVATSDIERNPAHNKHFTLNLELKNMQIRKVHPPLITHLNNEAIL